MSFREWLTNWRISAWASFRVGVPVVLLVIIGFYVTWRFVEPAPPQRVVMAAGAPGGAYDTFARAYAKYFADNGFELVVKPTAGSMENWQLMLDDKSGVDLAIVQGGTAPDNAHGVQAICSVYFEPLWVFYRDDRDVTRLTELAGKRLAVGKEGSGGRALALRLLANEGINLQQPGNTRFLDLTGDEAASALKDGKVDAVFFVIAPENSVVQDLIHTPGVKLMNFGQAEAYSRRFDYLSPVKLYRGVMDLAEDLPRRNMQLIAPAAMLVARKHAHHGTIELLVQAAKATHSRGTILSEVGEFPSDLLTDIPVSSDARYYLKMQPSGLTRMLGALPFWVKALIDRLLLLLIPLIALLLPMMRLTPALYRWSNRSRITRWYNRLKHVEEHLTSGASMVVLEQDVRDLEFWSHRLSRMRVPAGFMPDLYDLRDHLDRVREKLKHRLAEMHANPGST